MSRAPIYESLYCSVINFVLSTVEEEGVNYDFWMNMSSQPFNLHQQVMMPFLWQQFFILFPISHDEGILDPVSWISWTNPLRIQYRPGDLSRELIEACKSGKNSNRLILLAIFQTPPD